MPMLSSLTRGLERRPGVVAEAGAVRPVKWDAGGPDDHTG